MQALQERDQPGSCRLSLADLPGNPQVLPGMVCVEPRWGRPLPTTREPGWRRYNTQLASQGTANGAAPEQGGQYQTITGKILAIGWDITGGQKYWYLTLTGQQRQVYVGTVASVGPALVLAQPGDPVTIRVLNVGAKESTQTMQSFTDAHVPRTPRVRNVEGRRGRRSPTRRPVPVRCRALSSCRIPGRVTGLRILSARPWTVRRITASDRASVQA